MIILGIKGGKGAGKDTVAKYLVDNYGAKQYAFADKVKEYTKEVYDFTREQLYGTQEQKETIDPRYGISPRVAMQRVGDGARKVFGEGFWIRLLREKIESENPKFAVVSDVRRDNESAWVKRDGILWRLHYAPGLRKWNDSHASETEWRNGPVDLDLTPGSGGLSELYNLIDDACKMFGIEKTKRSVFDEMKFGLPAVIGPATKCLLCRGTGQANLFGISTPCPCCPFAAY